MNTVLKFCLCLMLGFFFFPVRAKGANVGVTVNTPAGTVDINRPPPQPVVVVPPPPERVVVEKRVPAPPPPAPQAAPPPPAAPAAGCHCSLLPVEHQVVGLLIFIPVFSLLFLRIVAGGIGLCRAKARRWL